MHCGQYLERYITSRIVNVEKKNGKKRTKTQARVESAEVLFGGTSEQGSVLVVEVENIESCSLAILLVVFMYLYMYITPSFVFSSMLCCRCYEKASVNGLVNGRGRSENNMVQLD